MRGSEFASHGRTERILSSGPLYFRRPGGTGTFRPFELIVAADNGLFWSDTGGSCWQELIGDAGRVSDVAYDPFDANALYGKQEKGMLHLSSFRTSPVIDGSFLPLKNTDVRTRLAVGSSRVYAISSIISASQIGEIEVTVDGKSWARVSKAPCVWSCAWWPALVVDPSNEQHLFYGETYPHQSFDGGATFTILDPGGYVHADFNTDDLAPRMIQNTLFASNDGGVFGCSWIRHRVERRSPIGRTATPT